MQPNKPKKNSAEKKILQIIYFVYGANNTSQRSITNEGIFSQVLRTRSSSFALPEEMPRHFLTWKGSFCICTSLFCAVHHGWSIPLNGGLNLNDPSCTHFSSQNKSAPSSSLHSYPHHICLFSFKGLKKGTGGKRTERGREQKKVILSFVI